MKITLHIMEWRVLTTMVIYCIAVHNGIKHSKQTRLDVEVNESMGVDVLESGGDVNSQLFQFRLGEMFTSIRPTLGQ